MRVNYRTQIFCLTRPLFPLFSLHHLRDQDEYWQGNSCQCCRVTLKAEVATSLYGIEDRYSCSVLLLCPEVLPVRSTAVRLNGKQYVVIGLEHGPGDISLRLDLREGF